MDANDFRRIALSLEGAEEGSHMGATDFRVGGRIFATLASQKEGYGNLMLTLEQQTLFVEELPDVFLPIKGGWGRMGATHIRLAAANEDVLAGALRTAWQLRIEKNRRSGKKPRATHKAAPAKKPRRKKTLKPRPAQQSSFTV
jgi:hypothetical protein